MRLRLGLGSVATGLLACLAACEEETTPSPLTFELPDGGPSSTQPDGAAPIGPGPVEAGPDATPVTKVNVTAFARYYEPLLSQAPRAGVTLFAVSTTGALVGTATTGADGKAALELPDGGSVTAVYPKNDEQTRVTVVTYAGVKPGDNLTFGDHETEHRAAPGSDGQLTVQWSAVANAVSYELRSPCYTSSTSDLSMTIPLSADCQTPTAPVALIALDDSEQVLASVYLPAASYVPNTTLDVTAGQWVNQAPATGYGITLTNLPTAVYEVQLRASANFGRLFYEKGAFVERDGSTATAAFSMPTTAPSTYAGASLFREDYSGRVQYLQTAAPPLSIDTADRSWVTSVVTGQDDRFVQWLRSPGTAYDAATLQVYWNKDETNYIWRVLLPPDTNQIDFRAFPQELAAFLPDSGFNIGLRLIDLSSAKNYDDVRALPEWHVMNPEYAVQLGDEPGVAAADGGEGYSYFDY